MTDHAAVAVPRPHVSHEAHDEVLGFWRMYVFSLDHKVIGIQYAITGLLFLLFGFCLDDADALAAGLSRAVPLPLIGSLLGEARMPGGTMLPEFYNEFGAMHGTIMVFLGDRAAGLRGVRQLRRAAPDRRAGHGLPADQHGQLLVLLPRRRDHARSASSSPAAPRSPGGPPTRRSRSLGWRPARRCGSSAWSS